MNPHRRKIAVDADLSSAQVIDECIAILDTLEQMSDTAFVRWLRGRVIQQLDRVWESSELEVNSSTKQESMKQLGRIKYWAKSYAGKTESRIDVNGS